MNKNPNYWQNKIAAYLNESVVKLFDISERKKYAKDIHIAIQTIADANKTKQTQTTADANKIKQAQYIASGLTRAALPDNEVQLDKLILKHPLVKNTSVSLDIGKVNVEDVVSDIKNHLETELAELVKDMSEEEKYRWIFNYLFFAYNKMLKRKNVGGLGSLWDILPADSRMPDHPMWHHFGMTSAIYSSLERNDDDSKENLSLVVYSITPVQEYIEKARKLRDYWTGSVLLSYLAFVGITVVMEELGPDHILYPSLQNQALVELWLKKKCPEFGVFLSESNETVNRLNEASKSIAAFPNKFVFLCNNKDVEEICKNIKERIDEEWKSTGNIVKEYLKEFTKAGENFEKRWDNALDKYWKYSWAASDFATINDETALKALLQKEKWQDEFEAMTKFNSCLKEGFSKYDVSNLYGTTHSLAQGLLAAAKTKPIQAKPVQYGEKCPLCGEHEVLSDSKADIVVADYNKNLTSFWNAIRKNPCFTAQVGENERLCAVCALKRFLPIKDVWKDDNNNHLLSDMLMKSADFPSTTEISAYEYLHSEKIPKEKYNKIIDCLHEHEFDTDDDYLRTLLESAKDYETKYYAFLLMDGDKMGDLINGETTEASWKDVINISENNTVFADQAFSGKKRTINPALHSMISDSLNNFARYGVQPAVAQGKGKLIYAGGDDVCAILPLSTAFKTADKIRRIYQYSYGKIRENGSVELTADELKNLKSASGKIVMHLGYSDNQDKTKISLSGAIIIAHHKQPLKEVIRTAHYVLDGIAKDKSGRNSLAIRLMKRSGGERDLWFKWEEENVFAKGGTNDTERESNEIKTCRKSFLYVINHAGEKLSSSLLYKIENLRGSFEPILFDLSNGDCRRKKIDSAAKKMIVDIINYEVAHSIYSSKENKEHPEKAKKLSEALAGICIKVVKNGDGELFAAEEWFTPEAAVIANFMAKSGVQGGENEW